MDEPFLTETVSRSKWADFRYIFFSQRFPHIRPDRDSPGRSGFTDRIGTHRPRRLSRGLYVFLRGKRARGRVRTRPILEALALREGFSNKGATDLRSVSRGGWVFFEAIVNVIDLRGKVLFLGCYKYRGYPKDK